MKRSRFMVLREAESGTPVKDLCGRAGISSATFYKWKTKYEGMETRLPHAGRLDQTIV